jgi:enoyl-CoA hydratase
MTSGNDYFLVVHNENGVTEVILARPKQMNSMDGNFFNQMKSIFVELNCDTKTNVILIWAEGKHFTAGLDLQFAGTFMKGIALSLTH